MGSTSITGIAVKREVRWSGRLDGWCGHCDDDPVFCAGAVLAGRALSRRDCAPVANVRQCRIIDQEIIMATQTNHQATLHHRAIHELKELAIISLYLYITLGAVILLKAAVLHTHGIEFAPWGIAAVKAVVLAKFMLLGHAIKLGERDSTKPLVWPTLRIAAAFLVLLIILTIVEETVVGLFHHRTIAASLGELFGARLDETLASYVIMLLILIPYCAFRVLSEELGEGRLERMFFVARRPIDRT
jgi:hypothetical protein